MEDNNQVTNTETIKISHDDLSKLKQLAKSFNERNPDKNISVETLAALVMHIGLENGFLEMSKHKANSEDMTIKQLSEKLVIPNVSSNIRINFDCDE